MYDLRKLSPKQLILLFIVVLAIYFTGFNENDNGSDNNFISGTVSRVIDGDTLILNVSGHDRRVRLLGVDTPETVHPKKKTEFYGPEASNFTKKNLTGKKIWLEYDKSPRDKYNRHLAYIWLVKPQIIDENSIKNYMFNAKLLLGGYAKKLIIKPNSKYADIFSKFELEARNLKRGLWKKN